MKIFAQISDNKDIRRIVFAENQLEAEKMFINVFENTTIDITNSKKCIGYLELGRVYDADNDAVLPAKIYDSWVIAENQVDWKAPTEYPTDGNNYIWDEESKQWTQNTPA